MRKTLTILAFLVAFSVKAQFSNDICSFEKEIQSNYHLPKQYKQQISQIKINFLRRMYRDTTSELCFGKLYCESFREYQQRYDTVLYVYDFNYDGKKDILFFGRRCPGYENTDVCIFFRNKKEYTIQRLGTWIVSLDLEKTTFHMTTVKYPCCADFMLQAMKYEGSKTDHEIHQLTNQTFGYTECKEVIQHDKAIISFSIDKPVMMYPDLDTESLEMFNLDGGALIGTLHKDSMAKSTNTMIINGKIWYYVIIDVNDSFTIEKSWNNDYFGKITTVRGWISE